MSCWEAAGSRRACQAAIRAKRSSNECRAPFSSVQWAQYRPLSIGMPQLSQLDVVVMAVSFVRWLAVRASALDQGAYRRVQFVGLARWQPGHGGGEQPG